MDAKKPDRAPSKKKLEKALLAMRETLRKVADQLPPGPRERMKEVMDFRASITEETDRGAVLMAAAFLDDKLKELLQKRMVEDTKLSRSAFEFNGPLGTFSSRIDIAYLFGLIPKNAQKDLHTIRAIRNKFAHQAAPLTYEDEKVKPLCDKLVFHGVKDIAGGGSKFRRSVMGLLALVTFSVESTQRIEAVGDHAVPNRTDAYKVVADIYKRVTGMDYPLKHEHE